MSKFEITYYIDSDSLEAAKKLAYVLLYLGDTDAEWVDVRPTPEYKSQGKTFADGGPISTGGITGSGSISQKSDGQQSWNLNSPIPEGSAPSND